MKQNSESNEVLPSGKESRQVDDILAMVLKETRKLNTNVPSPTEYKRGYSPKNRLRLQDYWRPVRKRIWLMISITTLITILVGLYMARKPNIYEAQARVEVDIENLNASLGNNSKNGSVVLNNPVNYPAYFNTQLQILTGPGLLRRVIKTLNLDQNEKFLHAQSPQSGSAWQNLLQSLGLRREEKNNAENKSVQEIPLISSVAPPNSREDLAEATRLAPYVELLGSMLRVEPVKEPRLSVRETFLIDLNFTNADPKTAAQVVNAIADAYVVSNLEKKTQANTTTGDYLQKRITELQTQIRSGEEQLASYAKNHQILSLEPGQNTVVDRLVGLNRQLMEAENERKSAEAAYRASLAPGAANALGEESAKQIADIEAKLIDLRQKRAQLAAETTEEWPETKEISFQIVELEKQVEASRNKAAAVVIKNLETRYNQALERERALRAAFDEQRGETLTQNVAAINYRILQQEIATNKNLLDGLLQRSKENDVVLAGIPNNASVVDYAYTPYRPVGPKRLQAIALALILSFCFSLGLAYFLEYLDDSLNSAAEVENLLGTPVLACIPIVGAMKNKGLLRGRKGLLVSGNGDNHRPELLINAESRSHLAEAYRQLRTSVLLSTAGRAPKTLLITSSVPAEGKTTTAINTAIILAQTGASVLLIDADLRRPRLHSVFGGKKHLGLSTILASRLSEPEILAMIDQHGASSLYVLNSGPIPPNPAELLGSKQMRELIASLETHFDHVIIDSPPILSFTDGVLISTMVDGVLFVAHAGASVRDLLQRAHQLLQDTGAKILGVILNRVDLDAKDNYYYHYGSYYYGSEVTSDKTDTMEELPQ